MSASAGVMSWFISNKISFIIIVWMASNVKNESKKLKMSFQLALVNLKISENAKTLFLEKVAIFDSVSLTGWKMFEFSKHNILSATGMILTYGLLVLQTENYAFHHKPSFANGKELKF
ncbi:uncharacterized protein CEXT_48881 [Caerostris extrusa]|uniref:Uncharacterized protein n=1 Tax=Caerostris extrusa TaxID=172846 RepID=A0AAV4XYX5_CAEEX|nr:uncharacterized protein CEXT_48881 [Caerostris extrusa]